MKLQERDFVLCTCQQIACEMSEALSEAMHGPEEKIRNPVLFDKRRPMKQQKYSFVDK